MIEPQQQAKHPVSLMAGPYGHPFHPILVTVPIGALAAASTGFLDLFAIPAGTPASRTALVHMTLNLIITAGFAAGFGWRYGSYHHPGPVAAGPLALSAVCLALLGVSGFLGGRLAFRYGVRVVDEATQARGYTGPDRVGAHSITPRRTSSRSPP